MLFFFNGNDIAAARDTRFKLVLNAYYKSFYVPFEQFGAVLLFDLEKDPAERFSYVREQADVVARLKAEVERMRTEIADMVRPPENPRPTDPEQARGPQLTTP